MPWSSGHPEARPYSAAAPHGLYDIVSGPFRPSRILGVSRLAVYLEVEDHRGAAVIALLARGAVRLPNGMVLADTQSVGPFADVAEATSVRIGRCSVVFGGRTGPRTVHVGRWWRPRVPRPPRSARQVASAAADLATGLADAAGGLPPADAAILDTDLTEPGQASRACSRLIGLGPGLTPSGDDLVCGFLLAARHFGGPHTALAEAAMHRAATATPKLSASLIGYAARGEGCPEVIDLLDAISGHLPLGPALAALRAIGHTSGTDLALGVLAGVRAALSRSADGTAHSPPTGRAHSRPSGSSRAIHPAPDDQKEYP